MNKAETTALRGLTDQGYAVIVWTPEELGDTSAEWVEERSIEYGWDYLIPQIEDEEEDKT
jgi:hypothetical protein